jgi:hypothetical protein
MFQHNGSRTEASDPLSIKDDTSDKDIPAEDGGDETVLDRKFKNPLKRRLYWDGVRYLVE